VFGCLIIHANVTGQRTRHLVEGTLDPIVQIIPDMRNFVARRLKR